MQGQISEIRRPSPMPIFVKGFDSFTITACFSILFIALENGFRSFYKPAFPLKTEPSEFKDIYSNVLKELIVDQDILIEYLDLMKILRLVRNAVMHHNGFHT